MNWSAIGALGEAFGAFAVFISLIYLAIQVRQNTGQAQQAAQRVMVDELGRALQAVAQNETLAEVYVQGLRDFYSLSLSERARFSGFMGHVIRIFQGLHAQHKAGTLDPESWAGVEALMRDVMGYAGARQYFALRKHHFSPNFRRYVEGEMLGDDLERHRLFGEEQEDIPVPHDFPSGFRTGISSPGSTPGHSPTAF